MESVKLSERLRGLERVRGLEPWLVEEVSKLEARIEAIKPIAWWIHGPVGATALVFSRNDIEPRIAELAKQYNADPSDFTATTFYAESFDHVR